MTKRKRLSSMSKRNSSIHIRCTAEQKQSMVEAARGKKLSLTEYILDLHNNSSGFIDKKGLKILLHSLLEPKVAKRLSEKYGCV